MIKGITYVHLLVEDWPMALEFYRDLVGLPVEQVFEAERWVTFEHGRRPPGDLRRRRRLDPTRRAPTATPSSRPSSARTCRGTVAALEARGVPFVAPLSETPEGYRTATFVDPEGNRAAAVRADAARQAVVGHDIDCLRYSGYTSKDQRKVGTWLTRHATSSSSAPARPG